MSLSPDSTRVVAHTGSIAEVAGTGNVATEDLVYLLDRTGVYLLDRTGVATGLHLKELLDTTAWLEDKLGKALPGAIMRAGRFPPT